MEDVCANECHNFFDTLPNKENAFRAGHVSKEKKSHATRCQTRKETRSLAMVVSSSKCTSGYESILQT
jgi:hypothetical protein